MRPVSEHHIDGDGPQMLEEAVCRSACDDCGAPFDDRQISRGVKREGKQGIQSDQDAGQGSLAVSEIVIEVVTIGFEDVECLVLDLPAGTAAGRRFGDAAGCDREIRNEAVEVGSLSLGVEDLDGKPVDRDGIAGGAQRHGLKPAIKGGGALATLADGLTVFLQFGAMEVFGDGLMRRWFAGENEAAAGISDGRDDPLAGKQIVTEIDRPKRSDRGAIPGQPAFRGVCA